MQDALRSLGEGGPGQYDLRSFSEGGPGQFTTSEALAKEARAVYDLRSFSEGGSVIQPQRG